MTFVLAILQDVDNVVQASFLQAFVQGHLVCCKQAFEYFLIGDNHFMNLFMIYIIK